MTVLIIGGAYQGKIAFAQENYPNLPMVKNLHLLVRENMKTGASSLTLLESLRGKCITCDEIGCGIIPLDSVERQWREEVGRLCCAVAAEPDTLLFRLTAGIPQRIQGISP